MINLDIAIYEVNMAELLAKFWIELCKIDDDPNTDFADVLAELTCQKKAIDSIVNYGEKIEIQED